jgi:alpha-galactosidase
MKVRNLTCVFVFGAVSIFAMGNRSAERLAPTPPMGWNSFDSYGVYLHEEAAYANLEAMAEKLKPHGYEFFVIDNGWFGEYALQEGTIYPAEKHAHDIRINEYGHFQPSEVYFPNGLKPIADRAHELGLKFGVHLMRGIPRKAYEQNLPIKGTKYTARDIANTDPKENCTWCTYCYGVDMTKPGAQEWYDGLIQHMADMGVDLIKYDDIVPHPDEVEAVAKAIAKTGKPIVLSLSPGGDVDPNALELFRKGNMLRVTKDVWDEQHYIDECFTAWRKWQGKEQPGFWIDMDMIPFGQLQLMSPPSKDAKKTPMDKGDIALAGKGVMRQCMLTKPQMKTFITMRALAASPLMMGGDLPTLDDFSLSLITDPEMLACNQNGVMGSLMLEADGLETWKVDKRGTTDEGWIGVFNRTADKTEFVITPERLGLDGSGYTLTEVWSDDVKPFGRTIKLNPHGVLFVKVISK